MPERLSLWAGPGVDGGQAQLVALLLGMAAPPSTHLHPWAPLLLPHTHHPRQVGKDARLDQFFQQPGEPPLTGPSK